MEYLAIYKNESLPICVNMSWGGIRDMVLFEIIGNICIPNDTLCRIDTLNESKSACYFVKCANYVKYENLTYVLAEEA